MRKHQIIKLKRFTLLFFIFSLPFEFWDPFGIASFFSITKMTGFLYASFAFLVLGESLDRGIFKYVRLLLFLWVMMVILNLLNYIGTNTVSLFNFTFLQNIILYWLIASDLKKQNVQIKSILLSFVLSIVFMSILLILGVGVGQEFIEGISRITFFENNPNTVGLLAGLAIVFSLYFVLYPSKTFQKKGTLVLLALPAFVNLLMLSGSRGALITTALSIVIMLIVNQTTPFKRILQVGLLIIAASYFLDKLMESEVMYKRLNQTIEEGNLGGREDLWEVVLEISSKSPLFGYGATGFENEMIKAVGYQQGAHNLFLDFLVTTGIVGLGTFVYFLYFHYRKAIKDFRNGDLLKIILLIFYLTTIVKAGGIINSKLMWVLLGLIISVGVGNSQKYIRN